MAHMRKMALVDPRLLETLRTPIQPPTDTNLRDLDSEMTSILDKSGIDVSEKVRLYNQALIRYNDMAKMSATKPTPVVVVKEKETPMTTDYYGRGRDDTSQSPTREGASAGFTFKDNTVERQRRVVARWDGSYPAVTLSILSTIYYENGKRLTLSNGNNSPARCVPQTYQWNWSVLLLGGDTYRIENGR